MKILIVGGGPGGLYAGLLLKKAHPEYDVQLFERNPADATYGWGVVFSDRTLSAFREADYPTFQQITDQFILWDAIDTYVEGERIRCGGHSFAGLSRQLLLGILQQRCRDLGVRLTFGQEWSALERFPEFDLVVAADGVNSGIRNAYADAFRPRLIPGRAKYIWLGTARLLDAFTFLFRQTEYGLFQAHAYPFDGRTSTFIVECREDVWQRAALDTADERTSLEFCEQLFVDFLEGHRLLSNNSRWDHFVTVRNHTWRRENVVLLGDAAHTAHFSIGSGTKLAMEDAIALANAFEVTQDLDRALNEYEMERRPRVEFLQEAAAESQAYFENTARYYALPPIQFVFHLLTRSGRIQYDHLRVRDPYFMAEVDRSFGRLEPDRQFWAGFSIAPPPAFQPLELAGITLPNRIALFQQPDYASLEGNPPEFTGQRLTDLARAGAALLLTAPVAVSENGRITTGCPGLYDERHVTTWREVTQAVRAAAPGTWLGLQLGHAGPRGATRPRQCGVDRPLRADGWPLISASDRPYGPQRARPRAARRADRKRVRQEFVRAARWADQAGFDVLHLNFAHGYLMASFISPLTNQRDDDYGGSLENRLRFPLEAFQAVREAWPTDKPIIVALSLSDCASNGLDPEDAVQTVRAFAERGCSLVHVLAGQTTLQAVANYGPGFLSGLSDRIRHGTGIMTMVGGHLTTIGAINSLLAAGSADLGILTPDRRR